MEVMTKEKIKDTTTKIEKHVHIFKTPKAKIERKKTLKFKKKLNKLL